MKRAVAYKMVVQELERWRSLGSDALIRQAGAPPSLRVIEIDHEPVSLEVSVSWRDDSRTQVRVEVTANGPSTWRMERVIEHADLRVLNGNE